VESWYVLIAANFIPVRARCVRNADRRFPGKFVRIVMSLILALLAILLFVLIAVKHYLEKSSCRKNVHGELWFIERKAPWCFGEGEVYV